MGNTPLMALRPFIPIDFPYFLRVGLCYLSFFAGDVATWGASDDIASIKAH